MPERVEMMEKVNEWFWKRVFLSYLSSSLLLFQPDDWIFFFFFFSSFTTRSCVFCDKCVINLRIYKWGSVADGMNDLPVIGYPCFAHRILGSPGGKHCESLQRNVWRGAVPPVKAVSLDRECNILPWLYEQRRWLMLVRRNCKFMWDQCDEIYR